MRNSRSHIFILTGVLLVAIVLRFYGLAWGWPYGFWGDEALYMPNAIRMLADKDLNTHNFHNSHLLTYVCAGEVIGVCGAARLLGVVTSIDEIGTFVWSHTPWFLLLGRMTVATTGVLTVLTTYAIGAKLSSRTTGLIAAWLLATAFLHVHDCHIAVNSVPMTLLVSVTLLSCINLHLIPSPRQAFIAGALTGLAIGTKYNAGIMLAAAFVAIVAGNPKISTTATSREGNGHANPRYKVWLTILLICGAAIGFALSNPYSLLSFPEFWKGFTRQVALGKLPWPPQRPGHTIGQIMYTMMEGVGALPCLAAMVGAAIMVWRSNRTACVVLAFPVVYLLFMARQQLFFPRFLVPVLPFVAVFAALTVDALALLVEQWVARRSKHAAQYGVAVRTFVTASLAVVLSAGSTARAVHLDRILDAPHTKAVAIDWLNANLSDDAVVFGTHEAIAGYGVRPRFHLKTFGNDMHLEAPLSPEGILSADVAILSDAWDNLYQYNADANHVRREFHRKLQAKFVLWKVFDPRIPSHRSSSTVTGQSLPFWDIFSYERAGPIIYVYQNPDRVTEVGPSNVEGID